MNTEKESYVLRKVRMARLQRKLAYSAARSDIECCALRVNDLCETPARWDVAILDNAAGLFDGDVDHYSKLISDAVQYLDWLGLLERNGEVSSVVTIKDLP
jgi:hypothetical protein